MRWKVSYQHGPFLGGQYGSIEVQARSYSDVEKTARKAILAANPTFRRNHLKIKNIVSVVLTETRQ